MCVVLHNIVREKDGFRLDDLVSSSSVQSLPRNGTKSTNKTGRGVPTTFANYFVSEEGALPWQLLKI